MPIHLVVLNYNGRDLLAECLPSVVRAARASRHDCHVAVIDNASSDGSLPLLRSDFPEVAVFSRPNLGLCSYNDVLRRLKGPVAVLLNNDIKLAEDAVDPLVEPLLIERGESDQRCFLTAPLCWQFDGETYEGLQTAVRWRFGLLQARSDYPGHERLMHQPGLTASAGAVMAVDRAKFLALGGFDPLYLPGRLEDLDFAFRGYMAGYYARYVPRAVAWHKGEATFRPIHGTAGSRALAVRNTLLFQWKNLRHPWHVARHFAALPLRVIYDLAGAPLAQADERLLFLKSLLAACRRLPQSLASPYQPRRSWRAERAFMRTFDERRIAAGNKSGNLRLASVVSQNSVGNALRGVPLSANRRRAAPRRNATEGVPYRGGRSDAHDTISPNLSIMVIALNEERNLPGLLERVRGADEIVLVDGGSCDRTVEIARSYGARVFVRPFDTFARQQNFALSLARGDWVLSLDADERPTQAMLAEIARRIRDHRYDAYRVRVRSSIFGRSLRFSGTQNDRQVRLVRRGLAAWRGAVHETLETAGRVGQLRHWLDHDPLPDLATFLAKMNRYTSLEAEARVGRRSPPRRQEAWLAPPREVFRRLVWKQGFWDGPQGWAFCLLSGLSAWVLAGKHRRLWTQAEA
ncbi:MAG TPA: glycosyltransferase [Pirellulales bacterium]|nr:glycosyltransferase [Pirellulales bacterium]